MLTDLKKRQDAPLWSQLFKYALCGCISVAFFFSIFLSAGILYPDYLDTSQMSQSTHQCHLSIVLALAFIPSNFLAYFSNRAFVFTPGKHNFLNEMFVFTSISTLSFIGGEVGKRFIVDAGYPNVIAALSFAVSSALVNFVARKFIVFKN